MTVPDLIEPFVGWKGMHVNRGGQLYSPQEWKNSAWPAAAPFEGVCPRHAEHEAPVPSCTCGIYAMRSFDDLRDAGYNWSAEYVSPERGECVAVVAEIMLWGRIRKGTIGFRAQFAYPLKVYVPGSRLPLGAVIRRRYGCPVGIIDRFSGERR